jgi:shikimate kinase
MLVDEANRALMIASGFVVCLDVTPAEIFMRLSAQEGANQRPLFSGDWQALYQQRQPAYAAIPYHVSTSGKTPEVVAEEIVALWQRESQ